MHHFHSSHTLFKEESVVEKSVKALKSQLPPSKSTEDESGKVEQKTEEAKVVTPTDTELEKSASNNVVVKKTLWQRFVAELKHYANGFRLLFTDVRVSAKLTWQLLKGRTLTRREHKQVIKLSVNDKRFVWILTCFIFFIGWIAEPFWHINWHGFCPSICLSTFLLIFLWKSTFLVSRNECPRSLCHSPTVRFRVGVDCMDKNFNLGNNFQTRRSRACVFLVTRPFTWYHHFLPCDLHLEVWPTFEKL